MHAIANISRSSTVMCRTSDAGEDTHRQKQASAVRLGVQKEACVATLLVGRYVNVRNACTAGLAHSSSFMLQESPGGCYARASQKSHKTDTVRQDCMTLTRDDFVVRI